MCFLSLPEHKKMISASLHTTVLHYVDLQSQSGSNLICGYGGDTNNEDKSFRITKLHRKVIILRDVVKGSLTILLRTLNTFSIDIYEGGIDDDD